MRQLEYGLNIFHVITGLGNGGAEALLFALLKNDPRNTHTVVSLTSSGMYGSELSRLGVRVVCLGMRRLPIAPSSYIRLYRLLKLEQPDLVQCWMYDANIIGGLIASLARLPVVWTIHQAHTDISRNGIKTFLIIRLGAVFSYLLPICTVYCSVFAREMHLRVGYSGRLSKVIENGIDTMRFKFLDSDKRAQIREKIFAEKSALPILGMVARYTIEKDYPSFVKGVQSYIKNGGECIVVLIGTEVDYSNEELVRLIEQVKLTNHVWLMGERADVETWLGILDLHILSSSVEGFGNVVAEAMACGTPCVGTSVGAVTDMIGNVGWVVPPRKPEKISEAIARAISMMKNEPVEWKAMRLHCRARIVENFSIEHCFQRYEKLWKNLESCYQRGYYE